MRKWLNKRKKRKADDLYKRGYDFAAGLILRGEACEEEIEFMIDSRPNEFDDGMINAIQKLKEV